MNLKNWDYAFFSALFELFSDLCGPLSDLVGSSLETGFNSSDGGCTASTLVAAFLGSNVVCFKTFLGIVLAIEVGGSPDPNRMLLTRIRALASSAASRSSLSPQYLWDFPDYVEANETD